MDILFKKQLPIGIYDSGIGGLNVLFKAKSILPNENYIYLGDNNNAPYGNKSIQELKALANKNIEILCKLNVKAICVACNTLSTSIYEYIKDISPVPIIPTLPINVSTRKDTATLIATPNTIKSEYVKRNFEKVFKLPLPFLAGEIERNIFSPSKINILHDMRGLNYGCDLIILGCTHYSFVKNSIKNVTGVKVVDTLDHTANLIEETLLKNDLINKNGGKITFIGEFKEYNLKVFKTCLGAKWVNRSYKSQKI